MKAELAELAELTELDWLAAIIRIAKTRALDTGHRDQRKRKIHIVFEVREIS